MLFAKFSLFLRTLLDRYQMACLHGRIITYTYLDEIFEYVFLVYAKWGSQDIFTEDLFQFEHRALLFICLCI